MEHIYKKAAGKRQFAQYKKDHRPDRGQTAEIHGLVMGFTGDKQRVHPAKEGILSRFTVTKQTLLYLSGNQISDISAVSGLTKLTKLWLKGNPLNTAAYCKYIPLIISNNPGIDLQYYANLNPITHDCSTDLIDFAMFAVHWLETGCSTNNNWCGWTDLNHDNCVDISDLKEFADYWLKGL